MILDRTKYVGIERTGCNRAQIRMGMLGRSDAGEHVGLWTAHETNVPSRDYFLVGWGDNWGGAL